MGFFIREKQDGHRAAGYGIYLAAGVAAFAAVKILHDRVVGAPTVAPARAQPLSNVAPITEAAALIAPVKISEPQSRRPESESFRLEKPAPASRTAPPLAEADSFNAIAQALKEAASPSRADDSRPARPLDERTSATDIATAPVFAALPPAFAAEPAGRPSSDSGAAPAPQLFGYRDPTAESINPKLSDGPADGDERARFLVPRGSLIAVYLLTTVDTGNPAATLQFATAAPLRFNGHEQIPFGTRFLGRVNGAAVRDRLILTADTVLYPDGLQLSIAATAVEADASSAQIYPGIAAYFFPPPAWAQVAPYLAEFTSGSVASLQARLAQPFSASVGGIAVTSASSSGAPRASLYQASAQALQDFSQARLKEIEQRYASHYLVPAGTACWLQLDRDLDLNRAHAPHRATLPLSTESPAAGNPPAAPAQPK